MSEIKKIDYRKFVRDAEKVHAVLKQTNDKKLIALKQCVIYVPVRYEVADLLELGSVIKVAGIFPIVVDDKYYAVCNVNAMIEIDPTVFRQVSFDEERFYEFEFDANSIVIVNTDLVKADTVIFPIFNEFIAKGNVPWFIGYEDYGNMFKTAKEYAGSNIANKPELTHLLVAMQSRDAKDRKIYYHSTIENYDDIKKRPPTFVPLKSVVFSATTTLNKLAGPYFADGVVSALANPTQRVEHLEEVLRA